MRGTTAGPVTVFKNALWTAGFPEREATIRGGEIEATGWTGIDPMFAGPLMCEFVATRKGDLFYGLMAPKNRGGVYVPADTPLRFEFGSQDRGIWFRPPSSSRTVWSLRIWLRYPPIISPPLPIHERGDIQGDADVDVYKFSVGLR